MRLKEYDYSQAGYYYVTVCVKNMRKLLCEIEPYVGAIINRLQTSVRLSEYGNVVDEAIQNIPKCYKGVMVDKYVIMPNHVHMILVLDWEQSGRLIIAPTTRTNLSTIIQQFKRHVSKQIGKSIWQKGYHDHIIRDDVDYLRRWRYIDNNPTKWAEDEYYMK